MIRQNKQSSSLLMMPLAMLLNACAIAPKVPDVNNTEPLKIYTDLVGKAVGVGNFSAIDGTSRDFTVWFTGSWDGEVFTLVEDFEYADGVKETKTWLLTQLPNGDFTGVREDIVGEAYGYHDGDHFRMEYQMAFPNDDGSRGRTFTFKDVIAKHSDGTISNTAVVGYYGLRVGQVNLLITPESSQ